jgi:hypothetical protein
VEEEAAALPVAVWRQAVGWRLPAPVISAATGVLGIWLVRLASGVYTCWVDVGGGAGACWC